MADCYLGGDGSLPYKGVGNGIFILSQWATLKCFSVEHPVGLWSYMSTAAHAWTTDTDYPKLLIEHFLAVLTMYKRLYLMINFASAWTVFPDYLCYVQFGWICNRNARVSPWNAQAPPRSLINTLKHKNWSKHRRSCMEEPLGQSKFPFQKAPAQINQICTYEGRYQIKNHLVSGQSIVSNNLCRDWLDCFWPSRESALKCTGCTLSPALIPSYITIITIGYFLP